MAGRPAGPPFFVPGPGLTLDSNGRAAGTVRREAHCRGVVPRGTYAHTHTRTHPEGDTHERRVAAGARDIGFSACVVSRPSLWPACVCTVRPRGPLPGEIPQSNRTLSSRTMCVHSRSLPCDCSCPQTIFVRRNTKKGQREQPAWLPWGILVCSGLVDERVCKCDGPPASVVPPTPQSTHPGCLVPCLLPDAGLRGVGVYRCLF